MPHTQEHVLLDIGVPRLEVRELRGDEGTSRLFRFEMLCWLPSETAPDPAALIGRDATIVLHDGFTTERPVVGIVTEAEVDSIDTREHHVRVVVRPRAYALTLGRENRAFHDMTVVDIAREVIGGRSPLAVDTKRAYPVRDYTVQYREDDWTFLSRMFEEEGIYYWFDHENGSTLTLSDTSTAAPDALGPMPIELAYRSGLITEREVVKALGSGVQVGSTKFTLKSFDSARPALDVSASEGDGPFEYYDAPGGSAREPAVIAMHTNVRRQAAEAARAWVAGRTSSVRTIPGATIEVINHPLPQLDKRYFVTYARYEVQQRQRFVENGADTFDAYFEAIDKRVPYRAPHDTPLAKQAGLQSGIVVGAPGQEVYPAEGGQVRVQQHWDRIGQRNERAGHWMRVAQRGAANSMLLPRIGWTVLTFNEEGDVDSPSVISRIHDGEHLPTYPLPANKTRLVFKTATTPGGGSFNEIRFEDKLGQEEMFFEASRDMSVLVQNIKVDRVEHDQTRQVGNNHTFTIGDRYSETISRDQTWTIGANHTMKAGVDHAILVKGDETISVGGSRKLKVGENQTYTVKQRRELTVGAAMIDTSLGHIDHTGGFVTTLVGGAKITMSASSISEDVGKVGVQMVGGVKLELAKQDRNVDIRGHFFETVGGALVLTTSGTYRDSADTVSSWKIGAMLTAKAPSVHIEAKEKIEISCGGSTLRILPESIEIEGAALKLTDSAAMKLITKEVEHN